MANILLVDDAPLVVETLSLAMKSKGHTVVTAANGIEGLKRFADGSFELVITDIIMPDKEGIQLIMDMLRLKPNAKIVAISGGGRAESVEFLQLAKSLGAVATLRKPIRLAEFFMVLEECLKHSGS